MIFFSAFPYIPDPAGKGELSGNKHICICEYTSIYSLVSTLHGEFVSTIRWTLVDLRLISLSPRTNLLTHSPTLRCALTMELGLSESLPALVARRFKEAKDAGHLVFSPTQLSTIHTAGVAVTHSQPKGSK